MDERIIYRERLPRWVFNGDSPKRNSIVVKLWMYRIIATGFIFLPLYLIFVIPKKNISSASQGEIVYAIVVTALFWVASGIIFMFTECSYMVQLDGNTPTTISETRISIPPRLRYGLTGEPNLISKEQIEYVVVGRKISHQFTSGSRKDSVIWKDSPSSITLILKSDKKVRLGFKPPSTIMEITDVLKTEWNIKVDDSGTGMGHGLRFINNKKVGEFSYDQIMSMDLFKWQN